MSKSFPKRPSGAPLHTLSKLYDVPVSFVTPSPFEAVYGVICGRWRVAVARCRIICLALSFAPKTIFSHNIKYVVLHASRSASPCFFFFALFWGISFNFFLTYTLFGSGSLIRVQYQKWWLVVTRKPIIPNVSVFKILFPEINKLDCK